MNSPYILPVVLWLGIAVVLAVEWWGNHQRTPDQRHIDRLARRDRRRG